MIGGCCMLDIIKLCQDRRIAYLDGSGHHHCRAGFVQMNCPNCQAGEWRMGFSKERGNFVCWVCGGLKFWSVLQGLLKIDDEEELRRIVAEFQIPGTMFSTRDMERKKTLELPPDTGKMLRLHRLYLEGRGFDPDRLETEWGLLGCGRMGGPKWSWRVIIPIRNKAGRMVAYQGRAIGDAVEPRYVSTANEDCLEPPETLIYGLDKAVYETALLVEGCTGVWRIGPGCVASLGLKFIPDKINQLRKFKRVGILVDPSPAEALDHAEKAAAHLAQFGVSVELRYGFDAQPGEYRLKMVRRLRREFGLPEWT